MISDVVPLVDKRIHDLVSFRWPESEAKVAGYPKAKKPLGRGTNLGRFCPNLMPCNPAALPSEQFIVFKKPHEIGKSYLNCYSPPMHWTSFIQEVETEWNCHIIHDGSIVTLMNIDESGVLTLPKYAEAKPMADSVEESDRNNAVYRKNELAERVAEMEKRKELTQRKSQIPASAKTTKSIDFYLALEFADFISQPIDETITKGLAKTM